VGKARKHVQILGYAWQGSSMPDRAYSRHGNLLTGQTRHHDRPNVDAVVE